MTATGFLDEAGLVYRESHQQEFHHGDIGTCMVRGIDILTSFEFDLLPLLSGFAMTELEALLAGIVSDPLEETRWLILADWLEEHDDIRRSELLRLHRKLRATCCEPAAHPERTAWQARIVELIAEGVRPCVPQRTLELPGGVPMVLSFIPPGSFLMGGNVEDDEKPIHKVTLTKGFFMGVHPVTQAQWQAVMDTVPSHFKGPNRPVTGVNWSETHEYCRKLTAELSDGGRVELPTEAEWEYACRAGTTTEYHYGGVLNPDLANYDGNYSWNNSPTGKCRDETTDVDFFTTNAWALSDLHGNIWEICRDQSADYSLGEQIDPQGISEEEYRPRLLRGGSWSSKPEECRAAYRYLVGPSSRSSDIGFRACLRLD